MLLRRITKHVKDQNWFAIGIDFCIVVIGVFMGIQVANWNDGLAENQREVAYLERLDKEFEVVEARITRAILVGEARTEATKTMLNAWEIGPSAFSDPAGKGPGELFLEILTNVVPTNPPAAFRELVASGELSILENEILRTALYEFDALSEVTKSAYETTQNDMREFRHLVHSAYLFEIDTLDDAFLAARDGRREPGSIKGRFFPEAFFGNDEFRQALNTASTSIINMRVLAQQQQDLIVLIDALIAEELAK